MPRLEELPPDLRATLSLLVDRGKSYGQVAQLLGISEEAVRDRAHRALDALAGAAGSAPPTAPSPSPGPSPAEGSAAGTPSGSATARPAAGGQRGTHAGGGTHVGEGTPALPVSRRGGAILLSAIAVAVIVLAVLLTTGGGGGGSTGTTGTSASTGAPAQSGTGSTQSGTGSSPSGGSHSSTGATAGSKARVTNQLALKPPDPASKTIGIAEILVEGSQHAIYLAAEHLPPTHGFSYVLWLYNSPMSAQAIGKTTVPASGRLQAGALLPANASDYHQLILTHETAERPTQPGPTVLSGAFSLGR